MGPLERRLRDHLGRDISTPAARRRAQFDYNWLDHGILRRLSRNRHAIDDGLHRSAQPSARDLAQDAAQGLKTVVNLRGADGYSHYLFEAEACAALGVKLVNLPMNAYRAPTRRELQALFALFDRLERPALIHCKSGADRTGLVAALWQIDQCGRPAREAARQLDWAYWHRKSGAAGVLDRFIALYAQAQYSDAISLRDWVTTVYDPAVLGPQSTEPDA